MTVIVNGIAIEDGDKVGSWRTTYGTSPDVLITFDSEAARDRFIGLAEEHGSMLQFLENPHVEEE